MKRIVQMVDVLLGVMKMMIMWEDSGFCLVFFNGVICLCK